MRRFAYLILALLAFGSGSQAQPSVPLGTDYEWIPVSGGFNSPLFVTHAGDGTGRLFVVEQGGYVFVVNPEDGSYDDFEPFLDVSGLLSQDVFQGGYTERGLLGLAFHPDYAENGLVFVNHTDRNGNTVIARYHVAADAPNQVDETSRTEILTIAQPYYDHNGGHMAFGADGTLYIGVGDGGSLGDNPGATAQDINVLLGKILRIDVDSEPYAVPEDNPFVGVDGAQSEIWAYGLRNPWRFSFDRETGDLYIGDVGQLSYEEIDVQAAGDGGGQNYGWHNFEGLHPYMEREAPENMTPPVAEYPHNVGCAVTGGYVYRGGALPELQGVYLFGDYCSGRIWSLLRDASGEWQVQPFMQTGYTISSFGEDEAGELYLVDYKGDVLRLARAE